MAAARVLITGFGPFPGVPDNPSAWLAQTLAADTQGFDCQLHAEVLPTEWDSVAVRAPQLYAELRPEVLLHFGLCRNAQEFRIERCAHNRVLPRADVKGALPRTRIILPQGPDRLDTNFPVTVLAAHLRARGLSAAPSRSAGRYLCNFLYYLSLAWAARQGRPTVALFIHIPPLTSQSGAFSEADLLSGAQETLRCVLDFSDRKENARQVSAGRAFANDAPLTMKDM